LRLLAGGTARVSITAETIRDAIIAPSTALLNADDGGQKVMVITRDNVAHERKVRVGARQDARVQIINGLKAGEQVVVSGGLGLEDKAKVKIVQPQAAEEEDEKK
jgi:multidrug efflux pump subunit AcrA (membrane-fusion protein)